MSHVANPPRYLCSELVNVLCEDPSLILNQIVANLEEISSTHATLFVEKRLEPGSPVSFHAKGYDLNGFVESCDFHEILGWIVKIEFETSSRWNVQMFTPDHSLPITELVYSQANTLSQASGH
jgi:hypothetical protein